MPRRRHDRRRSRDRDRHRPAAPRGHARGRRGRGRRGRGRGGRCRAGSRRARRRRLSPAPHLSPLRATGHRRRPAGGRAGQSGTRVRGHAPQRRRRGGRAARRQGRRRPAGRKGRAGPGRRCVTLGDKKVALAVPTTYMNESGLAVRGLAKRFGIDDPTSIVVVHDELDLPPGHGPGEGGRRTGRPQRVALPAGAPAHDRLRAGAHRRGQAAQRPSRGRTTSSIARPRPSAPSSSRRSRRRPTRSSTSPATGSTPPCSGATRSPEEPDGRAGSVDRVTSATDIRAAIAGNPSSVDRSRPTAPSAPSPRSSAPIRCCRPSWARPTPRWPSPRRPRPCSSPRWPHFTERSPIVVVTATGVDADRVADDLACLLPRAEDGRRPSGGRGGRGTGRRAAGLGDAALRAGQPRGRDDGPPSGAALGPHPRRDDPLLPPRPG